MFGSLQFDFGYRILDKISIRFADDKVEVPRLLRRDNRLDASTNKVEGRNRAPSVRRRTSDEPTSANGKVERRFAARYYFEQSSTISCGLTGKETSS
jgi:hypothetical protein